MEFLALLALAVIVAVASAWQSSRGGLIGAAILVTAPSLYLAMTPRFRYMWVLPLLPLLAAWALSTGRRKLTWALAGAFIVSTAWLVGWLAVRTDLFS